MDDLMSETPVSERVAAVNMVSGSMVGTAECKDILSSYEYVESIDEPQRFDLMSDKAEDSGASLSFSDDFDQVVVYGDRSEDNLLNLNYILRKMGWVAAVGVVHTAESRDRLVRNLSSVSIDCQVVGAPRESFSDEQADNFTDAGIQVAFNAPPADEDVLTDIPTSEGDLLAGIAVNHQELSRLTIELQECNFKLSEQESRLEEKTTQLQLAEATNAEHVARIGELERENATLRSNRPEPAPAALLPPSPAPVRSVAMPAPAAQGDDVLIGVIEEYLSTAIDHDSIQSPLLKKLQEHGYQVKVRIVKSDPSA